MRKFWSAMFCLLCLSACQRPVEHKPTVQIACAIPPQAWLVEALCGEDVGVTVILPMGASPATFRPSPQLLSAIGQSDYLLLTGLPIENSPWHQTLQAYQPLQAVDLNVGLVKRAIGAEVTCACCNADGLDPHIWLDPIRLRSWAFTLKNILQADPRLDADVIEMRWQQLQSDLLRLDRDLRQALAPVKHKPFVVTHPCWGYFAERYDMQQLSIEPGGHAPSDNHLQHIFSQTEQAGVSSVIIQSNAHPALIQALQTVMGLDVICVDELSSDPVQAMRAAANAILISHDCPVYFEMETRE